MSGIQRVVGRIWKDIELLQKARERRMEVHDYQCHKWYGTLKRKKVIA